MASRAIPVPASPKGRPLSTGPSLPAWATRGLAGLLLLGAVALPWLATWQGVLKRLELEGVAHEPELVQLRPELVLVPGGRFRMGSTAVEQSAVDRKRPRLLSPLIKEHHQHDADVAPLYVCRTEVTRAQWQAVMGATKAECPFGCEDDHPVSNIERSEALYYMRELTDRENKARAARGEVALTACYECVEKNCFWDDQACTGFRLPTETEWEYVARAGTATAYSFGDNSNDMCKYGNGADRSMRVKYPDRDEKYGPLLDCDDGHPDLAPVGSYAANPWGLYDMHGNLWEWVWDEYSPKPAYEATGLGFWNRGGYGELYVLRGGNFWSQSSGLRAAARGWNGPVDLDEGVGLRCVRSAPPA